MAVLSGCGSEPVKPLSTVEKPVPDWFLNPPQDTLKTLYGAGEGTTRKGAISAALVDLASKLSVEVSSTFETNLTVTESTYTYIDRSSQKNIQSEVRNIRINQYQTEQVARLAYGKYVAVVSVQRQQLFKDLLNQQQQQMQSLEVAEKAETNKSDLARYLFYKTSLESLDSFRHRLLVMQTLNTNFSPRMFSEFLAAYETQVSTLKSHLIFTFEADADSTKMIAPLQNALTKEQFKVQKSTRPGTFSGYFKLKSNTQKSQAYGFYIVRLGLQIEVSDGVSTLGGQKLNLKGQSTQGYDQAIEFAAIKFQKQLETQGLNKVVGLNLLNRK